MKTLLDAVASELAWLAEKCASDEKMARLRAIFALHLFVHHRLHRFMMMVMVMVVVVVVMMHHRLRIFCACD
ncbi:hypothetical protein [Bradyrhizobium sp.]|uniref:hypothetical protein n=1 Tax=Bradyrhizobium sp. TaxID=376 RepID=UPI003C22F9B7